MATSAFDEKSSPPQADQLHTVLGRAARHWEALVERLASAYPPLTETWKYGGQKWGWALRLQRKKRTVVWLTPCRGHFIAGFALGEKAVQAAHESGLPAAVLTLIDGAKKYAEGRAVRLEVRTQKDARIVEQVAAAKMAT
jgi:hypothetical protein